MQKYVDVEVLTTCALDYLTWKNHYPAGITVINGVSVHRFLTDQPRDMKHFNAFARTLFAKQSRTLVDELTWIQLQGPYSSELLTYIKEHEAQFDLFIFVTYSYATTFLGLQLVPRKSLLIPAAHDEPQFYFTAYQPIFHIPLGIMYNTNEERRLVQTTWGNSYIPWCIAGVGVSPSGSDQPAPSTDLKTGEDAQDRFALPDSPYLLYIGRIDVMKGCRQLIAYFLSYLQFRPDLHLMLIGKPAMEIPDHPHIHAVGFVSEAQKNEAIQKAILLVNPSEYESLSLVILEAWQQGIPVVVNGRSDVLAEHCLASNGGLYYTNYDEFVVCLELLLSQQKLRHTLGQQGKQYVKARYTWNTVEKTYVDFIMKIGE